MENNFQPTALSDATLRKGKLLNALLLITSIISEPSCGMGIQL